MRRAWLTPSRAQIEHHLDTVGGNDPVGECLGLVSQPALVGGQLKTGAAGGAQQLLGGSGVGAPGSWFGDKGEKEREWALPHLRAGGWKELDGWTLRRCDCVMEVGTWWF